MNDSLVGAISLGANPTATNPADALEPSILGSWSRLEAIHRRITDGPLRNLEADISEQFRRDLQDSTWMTSFPGRLILGEFVRRHLERLVSYEAFRNLVIDQMVDDKYQPLGMKDVLEDAI